MLSKRGKRCIYRCLKTGITVVHHIDDGRCAGNAALDGAYRSKFWAKPRPVLETSSKAHGLKLHRLDSKDRLAKQETSQPLPRRASVKGEHRARPSSHREVEIQCRAALLRKVTGTNEALQALLFVGHGGPNMLRAPPPRRNTR